MYRRYIFVANVAFLLTLTVACAGPEAEKAIFVARETTPVRAQPSDQQAMTSTTTKPKPSDQNTNQQTDVAPTTEAVA
ncbi:MAG TPA: hypothetical protein DCL16_01675, partial [Acidimicrobiaceae bacterium]|nr:hypothetical protein [Acidimicrobiaceae bacterium]